MKNIQHASEMLLIVLSQTVPEMIWDLQKVIMSADSCFVSPLFAQLTSLRCNLFAFCLYHIYKRRGLEGILENTAEYGLVTVESSNTSIKHS